MSATEFLYFDLGNVLFFFDYRVACRRIAALCGGDVERVWQAVYAGNLLLDLECGRLDRGGFHRQACAALEFDFDLAALELAVSDMFVPNYRLLAVAAKLEDAGYRLGILSNTSLVHWSFLRKRFPAVLPRAFSVAALSYEIGALKPAPVIYEAAARLAGVRPERIFYCDDIPANVEGARAAGFDAVCFTDTPALAVELRRRGLRFNY